MSDIPEPKPQFLKIARDLNKAIIQPEERMSETAIIVVALCLETVAKAATDATADAFEEQILGILQ